MSGLKSLPPEEVSYDAYLEDPISEERDRGKRALLLFLRRNRECKK